MLDFVYETAERGNSVYNNTPPRFGSMKNEKNVGKSTWTCANVYIHNHTYVCTGCTYKPVRSRPHVTCYDSV